MDTSSYSVSVLETCNWPITEPQGRSHQVRFGGGTKSASSAENFFLHVPPNFGILGGPNDLSLYRPKDV